MDVHALSEVFGGQSESPVFVTDNTELREWLSSNEITSVTLSDSLDDLPNGVVFLPTKYSTLPVWADLRELFRGRRVLWVPLDSFDSSLNASRYSISLLLQSDIVGAVTRNRHILARLLTGRDFKYSGPGTDLTFSLVEEVHVNSRTRVELVPGEHASVGAYFEVGLATNWMEIEEAFHVSGTMNVEGVLVSRHREMPNEIQDKFDLAVSIREELMSRVPIKITLDDSRVVKGSFGEYDTVLHEVTNPRFGGLLTELAWGTNTSVLPSIDWSINSQFNEGVGGVHMALGDGVTGAHIDFVCSSGSFS